VATTCSKTEEVMATTATKLAKKKSIYGVHPGVLMTQKWIAELKGKTRTQARRMAAPNQERGTAD